MNDLQQETDVPEQKTGKRKRKKRMTKSEKNSLLWKKHIIKERGIPDKDAAFKVERLEKLIEYMQYGHAYIAYYKQDEIFCMATATLVNYEDFFHLKYDRDRVKSTIVFWDREQQGWRSFRIENFLEWKPIA